MLDTKLLSSIVMLAALWGVVPDPAAITGTVSKTVLGEFVT